MQDCFITNVRKQHYKDKDMPGFFTADTLEQQEEREKILNRVFEEVAKMAIRYLYLIDDETALREVLHDERKRLLASEYLPTEYANDIIGFLYFCIEIVKRETDSLKTFIERMNMSNMENR